MTVTPMDAEVVAWRWSLLSWLEVWHVIEMFVVVLSTGFALGYYYAKRQNERASVLQRQGSSYTDGSERASVPERARSIPSTPIRCEYCTDDVNPNIFPYKRCSGCGASPSYHHGRCCPVKKMQNKEQELCIVFTSGRTEQKYRDSASKQRHYDGFPRSNS